jgi:inner membrane protein
VERSAALQYQQTLTQASKPHGVGPADHPQVQRMARFSDGFFKLHEQAGDLFLSDLRMGQQPYYVFTFNLGAPSAQPLPAARNQGVRGDVGEGLRWLGRRMRGEDLQAPGA